MEIRTCEEYVLAQLKDALEQVDSLENEVESLKLEVQYLKMQLEGKDVPASDDNI